MRCDKEYHSDLGAGSFAPYFIVRVCSFEASAGAVHIADDAEGTRLGS